MIYRYFRGGALEFESDPEPRCNCERIRVKCFQAHAEEFSDGARETEMVRVFGE